MTIYDKTSDHLWRGACEVAGCDPVQCIHDLRSELATAKAQLAEWVKKADAARQPEVFYTEYSEGTMRAMQAMLTDASSELAAANEKSERYRLVTLKQDAENEALQTESGKLRVLLIRANKWVRIIDARRNEVPQWLRHDGDPHQLRADINAALAAAREKP